MKNVKIFSWIAVILLSIFIIIFFRYDNTVFKNGGTAKITIATPLNDAILKGFKSGDIELLFPYFEETISLSISDEENEYKAAEAKIPLKSFFERHPPKYFSIQHSGKNKSGKEKYWIGDYTNESGMLFRIYILSNQERIQSIEVSEKNKEVG